MASSQEEWIYLDEELPEVHIRELISMQELLEKNQNFVALSDEEIYNQLLLMFKGRDADNEVVARGYLDMHKDATSPADPVSRYCRHIVFQTNAKRKDFGTDNSEEDYFEILKNIKNTPNYGVREQIKNELQEPFEEATRTEDGNRIVIPRKRRLQVRLQQNEYGVSDEVLRVEADKENYDILSGEFYAANHADSMHMSEHVAPRKPLTLSGSVAKREDVDVSKIASSNPDAAQGAYFDVFARAIVPSFKYIIRHVNSDNTSDMRSLKVLFQLYGRDLEDIDTDAYSELVNTIRALEYNEPEDKKDKGRHAKRDIKPTETSYTRIFRMFWSSIIARLRVASDAPLYSEMINNAIALILAKPFKGDIYTPVPKQLEKLRNGSIKLDEFVRDIQLLKNLDERNLLSEFRNSVQSLQSDENPFPRLEEHIKEMERLAALTVDPEQAEGMFSTKGFVKEYTDPDQIGKGHIQPDVADEMDHPNHFINQEVDAYVENPPENEDDVEQEEEEDELGLAIARQGPRTPLLGELGEISGILTRIQRLTNMPWNPTEFVRMMIQRSPPMIDVPGAMHEIDKNIRKDILERIAQGSIDDAIALLPIDQHTAVKNTYHKALRMLREQKASLFYLFLSYWVVHVQTLMLDDLFVLQDITSSPCKAELTSIGYPIEEGREGKKGVLRYLVCILHEEGHDIPNINEFVDDYSKEQLSERIKSGFVHFSHEIDALKKLAYSEVSYEGNLAIEEAKEAYDTILKLRKQSFQSRELLKPYIKSLQLLPSIPENVKDRSKHILGCCYTRLDPSYLAAKNLSNRLNASKNYFARERIGNKDRPVLMYYGKPIPPAEFGKKEKEVDVHLVAIGTEQEEQKKEDWRETIKGMPFLSNEIKNIIRKENRQEVSQLNDEAQRYLEALYRTTGTQIPKGTWPSIQKMSVQELVGLFGQVSYDFYLYNEKLKEATMEIEPNVVEPVYRDEIGLIGTELRKAKDVMNAINGLDVDEGDIGELKAIIQLVLCRTLCLPGNVEPNKRTITTDRIVKANFVQNLAGHIGRELRRHIDLRSTPTLDEIDKKISEIREKRKIETIRQYEMNPELNKLVKQARLQGIRVDVETEGEGFVPNRISEDDRADLEGALEFQMPAEDPDEMDMDGFNDW